MTTRLVYDGNTSIAFMSLNLEVHPGDAFSVPDDQAEAYLSRGDISLAPDPAPEPEPVVAPPSTPSKAKKDTTSDQATPVS